MPAGIAPAELHAYLREPQSVTIAEVRVAAETATAIVEQEADIALLHRTVSDMVAVYSGQRIVVLSQRPLVSVSSIVDALDPTVTVPVSDIIMHAERAALEHVDVWPIPPSGWWRISYTAGIAAASNDLPDGIRQILLECGAAYATSGRGVHDEVVLPDGRVIRRQEMRRYIADRLADLGVRRLRL